MLAARSSTCLLSRLLAGLLCLGLVSCASTPQDAQEVHFDAAGQRVRAIRKGDPGGERVIFVHGSPGNAEAWGELVEEPLPGTESLSIDRPGYGGSDSGAVVELLTQAQAIEPLLVERGGRNPILVGHSLGGPIIAKVAALWPERVGGLVIIAGSLSPDLESLRWYNYVARGLSWVMPRSIVHSNREMWVLEEQLACLEPELNRITCPVVIVHGRRDTLVSYENVDYMLERFENAQSVEVRDFESAGHFIIWGDRYVAAIRQSIVGMLATER